MSTPSDVIDALRDMHETMKVIVEATECLPAKEFAANWRRIVEGEMPHKAEPILVACADVAESFEEMRLGARNSLRALAKMLHVVKQAGDGL
jgi:hypothetical protein